MKRFETIYSLLITLAVTIRCLSFAHGENSFLTRHREHSINHEQPRLRIRRSGNLPQNPRQNCNTWSPWINTHHPVVGDPNDKEQVTQQEMNVFCPPNQGGKVTEISCKDEKGEPFHGNKTDPNNEYFVSCNTPVDGVECVWLVTNSDHCPDLSMQYYCSCSNDTRVISTSTRRYTTNASKLSLSDPSTLSRKTWIEGSTKSVKKQNDGFSGDQVFVPWWLLYILITVVLFSISMSTTLCLYKQLQRKLTERKQTRKVHPTAY